MAILIAGTSLSDNFTAVGAPGTSTTASTKYANVSEAFDLSTADAAYADFAAQNDLWLAYYVYIGGSAAARNHVAFFDTTFSTTQPIFTMEISTTSPRPMTIKAWNGTTLTALATAAGAIALTSLQRIDIHIRKADSGGAAEVYVGGTLQFSFSGDTNVFTSAGINRCQIACHGSGSTLVSGIIIADEDTRAMLMAQSKPTAGGGVTQWAGLYTTLNETTIDDTTMIVENTVGEISTFTKTTIPASLNALTVQAVVLSVRGQVSDAASYDVAAVMRIGGVNYQIGTDLDFTPGVKNKQVVIAQNPATGAAWTFAAADGAEIGVKLVSA